MEKVFFTVKDIISRYNISKQTLYYWLKNSSFSKGFKLGKLRRWRISDVLAWEDSLYNSK